MANRFAGQVVVVTGGNSGIGAGTAARFAHEGARVALLARREEQGRQTESAIRGAGSDATFIPCDVTNVDSIEQAVAQTMEEFGAINVLFNNAGGGGRTNFPDESNDDWNRVLAVNLTGTFYMSRAVWPHMIASGGGTIVNMSSLSAQRGFSPHMFEQFGVVSASYFAAKAGVDALTRYMAGMGGKHNIRVNAVRPGQIMTLSATGGTLNDPDGGHHRYEKLFQHAQIVPGPGQVDDVANLVLFLACDESRFITGEMINVDGGVAAKI